MSISAHRHIDLVHVDQVVTFHHFDVIEPFDAATWHFRNSTNTIRQMTQIARNPSAQICVVSDSVQRLPTNPRVLKPLLSRALAHLLTSTSLMLQCDRSVT